MLKKISFPRYIKIVLFIILNSLLITTFAQFNLSSAKKAEICKQAPNLKPAVLNLALHEFDRARAEKMINKPIITIVDYSIPSNKDRLWVINLDNGKVLETTLVAHGKGSGTPLMATRFSDQPNSKASSLGTYITGNTYYGKHGLSLRLNGITKNFNDKVYGRTVVLHPAAYVSESYAKSHGYIGRSWGCLAVSPSDSEKIISLVKDRTMMFAYYPDKKLLNSLA